MIHIVGPRTPPKTVNDETVMDLDMVPTFSTDEAFRSHFRRLHQVFMYVTDRCNPECEQCIYKPSISHFIR